MTSGLLFRQLRRQNVWRWHRSVTAPRHIDVQGSGTLGAGTGDVPVGPPADHPWALLSSGFTGVGSLPSGGATPNTVAVLAAQARGGGRPPEPGRPAPTHFHRRRVRPQEGRGGRALRSVDASKWWLYRAVVTSHVDGFGRRLDPRRADVHVFGRRWISCRRSFGMPLVKAADQAAAACQWAQESSTAATASISTSWSL